MSKYFVRTVEAEFRVDTLEAKLISELLIDENIANRFPFDDSARNSLEIYKIGSKEECQDYIDEIDLNIKHLFRSERFTEEDYSNPLIDL